MHTTSYAYGVPIRASLSICLKGISPSACPGIFALNFSEVEASTDLLLCGHLSAHCSQALKNGPVEDLGLNRMCVMYK